MAGALIDTHMAMHRGEFDAERMLELAHAAFELIEGRDGYWPTLRQSGAECSAHHSRTRIAGPRRAHRPPGPLMRRRTRVAALGIGTLLLAGCGTSSPLPIGEQAAHYRLALRHGQVVARLCLPRFHTEVAILDGFDHATINRGPGWYPRSRLPGEGRLIYIAGHHRMHGAPFRDVAELAAGDRVVIITPYATASYVVTSRTIISGRDLAVLRSPTHEVLRLQTSTVPAGSRRILVTATLSTIRRGTSDMRSRGCRGVRVQR